MSDLHKTRVKKNVIRTHGNIFKKLKLQFFFSIFFMISKVRWIPEHDETGQL